MKGSPSGKVSFTIKKSLKGGCGKRDYFTWRIERKGSSPAQVLYPGPRRPPWKLPSLSSPLNTHTNPFMSHTLSCLLRAYREEMRVWEKRSEKPAVPEGEDISMGLSRWHSGHTCPGTQAGRGARPGWLGGCHHRSHHTARVSFWL